MPAVTVEKNINDMTVAERYFTHNEMAAGEVDAYVELARLESAKSPGTKFDVYLNWHEHDICDPEICNGINYVVVPRYTFIDGKETT